MDSRLDSSPDVEVRRRQRPARLIVFAVWLGLALFLASRHVMWRDEVRAWSIALSGDRVTDMLRAVHGEGHPALWYLILRGTHALAPWPQTMPVAAFVIGAAAALLFALLAPFRWPFIALALAGRFALYEYTVMARNYGISMLTLFGIAALYGRHRDRGWVIGGLLFVLCNTNVHSVMLAAAFLMFWTVDVASTQRFGWNRPWRALLIGASMAAAGAAICIATVYPPFNDAAQPAPGRSLLTLAWETASRFNALLPTPLSKAPQLLIMPLLLGACLLRFVRTPGGLVAVAGAYGAFTLLFTLVYAGFYRHEALILPFLLTIAWLIAEGRGGVWPARIAARLGDTRRLEKIGAVALVILLSLQVVQSLAFLTRALRGMPESRSAELAKLLHRPDLRGAVVVGDPDYNLEALPYYVTNPTYFVRERRYGRWVFFSWAAKRTMTPSDMLNSARRLQAETGRPIVLVMSEWSFRHNKPVAYPRGFYGDVVLTAADMARFRAGTRLLADYGKITAGDESYSVFLLKPATASVGAGETAPAAPPPPRPGAEAIAAARTRPG